MRTRKEANRLGPGFKSLLARLMWKDKVKEWVCRYGLSLTLAIPAAVITAKLVYSVSGSLVVAALAATWADNIVFYGLIAYKDLKRRKRRSTKSALHGMLKLMRNMIFEFSPAEYLDSFLIRPFYLSVFPYLIANYSLAIFLGSLAAEISYFIPTILAYELRKKVFKD